MKHTYDWSKLDTGWTFNPHGNNGSLIRHTDGGAIVVDALERWQQQPGDDPVWVEFKTAARAQLAKCRVVECDHDWNDNCTFCVKCGCTWGETEPNEARDKTATETGWNVRALGLSDDFIMWSYTPPPPPWRRGPLATWTLVNISCHDGRLTVVMRRGRGEAVIETGVDDEAIWERLALKVVDIDKVKEKSDV